ncbi:SRPBCC family protein [Gymnodinialimonas sp.]
MFKRLYSQRRRIAVVMLLLGLAVALSLTDNPELRYYFKHSMEGPLWINQLSYGLAVAIVPLGACGLVILLFPSLRGALELGALTFVLVETARFAAPMMPAWMAPWMADGSTQIWWWPVLYFGLALMRESPLFGRLSPKLPLRFRDRRKINATPAAIWAALAPDADNLGTYWNNVLTRVADVPGAGGNVVEARFKMGKFGALIQRHTRHIWNKPLHFLYDFEPESDAGAGFSGSYEMKCEPLDDGRCLVTSTQSYPGLGFGTWSFLWLDDILSDEMNGVVAKMNGRRDWSLGGWAARKLARSA